MPDHLPAVFMMLGAGGRRFADPGSWTRLESEIGTELPTDYKEFVDEYAPIKVNGHLYFNHPATTRWNLLEEIRQTEQAFRDADWDGLPHPDTGADGVLIPALSTDFGFHVFLRRSPQTPDWSVVVHDRDEGGYWEHAMGFAEWLHRHLIGEEVIHPNGTYFYPGPVKLEHLPMSPEDRPEPWHGPERGM
ncbi:SMI1/KNR4 family protein [Kitasatospora aureofaciens]|uniref:SMI1/KNR4 family protein n=1 Tax=Kitasatospora aureofaciens TaxID=1894 RepID=UPI0033BF23C9